MASTARSRASSLANPTTAVNRRSAFVVALAADPRAVTVASVASPPKISFTCVADVLALSGPTSKKKNVLARARPPSRSRSSSRRERRSRSSNGTSASMRVAIFRARRPPPALVRSRVRSRPLARDVFRPSLVRLFPESTRARRRDVPRVVLVRIPNHRPRAPIPHTAARGAVATARTMKNARTNGALEDDIDECPISTPVESECFDSDSDVDARYSVYAGANGVYADLRHRPSIFLRRNLSYHVERRSASGKDARGTTRMRAARERERDAAERVTTTYELHACGTQVRTRGYACDKCACVCDSLRGLMTHLRASHDLLRYSAEREGGETTVRVYPKGENFDEHRVFKLRTEETIRSANDKEFQFFRRKDGREVFLERVPQCELDEKLETKIAGTRTAPLKAVWRAIATDDHYERIKRLRLKRKAEREAAEEAARIAAMPYKPSVCKKTAIGSRLNGAQKWKPAKPDKPLGPFYKSRAFIEMATVPEIDSDEEDRVTAEIYEGKRAMHEFVDFSAQEISFMEAWNEVAIKFKPVAEYDSTSLCEAFVRTYTVRLKTDHAFFRHFVLTIFNLFEHGILNRRQVQGVLSDCKTVHGAQKIITDRDGIGACQVAVFEAFPTFESTLENLRY